MDCYDLISYKNSFAQLRLGLNAQLRGDFEEAIQRLNISKQKGNFYANAALADIYKNGFGVAVNNDLAVKLLEDTKEIDPIAAYRLSFYYLDKNKVEDALELLNYAAINDVKAAQLELSKLYLNGEFIERNTDKASYWQEQYEDTSANFANKIYGI
jgi:TPR repeat protein